MFANAEFKANPYPTYNRLRSRGPIHWVDSFGGAWLLPRYADVVNALRDSRLSARRSHLLVSRLPPEARGEFAEFNRIVGMWMMLLDPPQHSGLRKLMDKGFTPRLLQTMRPRIQKIADWLLDKVKDVGKMDFIRDFAYPFPALVIAEMLGVDPADRDRLIAWSDDIATFMGPKPTLDLARRAQNSLLAITEYFQGLLPERRKNLSDDLISLLIRVEEQGDVLTTEQLIAQCSLLLAAGHETTRNLLGNGLLALLQHPDKLEILKSDPSLMPNALRELLRYESPIQFIVRLVTKEFTLHSKQIKQGQFVICLIGAANRDPAQFTNPDMLDITRQKCSHLAFGYDTHFCIGASLAYLESEIAFNTLLNRMPNLRLVDDRPDWNPNLAFRALNTLRLTF